MRSIVSVCVLAACGGHPAPSTSGSSAGAVTVTVVDEGGADPPAVYWRDDGGAWARLPMTGGTGGFTPAGAIYELASQCTATVALVRATVDELPAIDLLGCGKPLTATVTLAVTGLAPDGEAAAATSWRPEPVVDGEATIELRRGVRDVAILEGGAQSATGDTDTERVTLVRDVDVDGPQSLSIDAATAIPAGQRAVQVAGAATGDEVTVVSEVDTEHGARLVLTRDRGPSFTVDELAPAAIRAADHAFVVAIAESDVGGTRVARGDGPTLTVPAPVGTPTLTPSADGYTIAWPAYDGATFFEIELSQEQCPVEQSDCYAGLGVTALVTAGAAGGDRFATPPPPSTASRWFDAAYPLDYRFTAYTGAVPRRAWTPMWTATTSAARWGVIDRSGVMSTP